MHARTPRTAEKAKLVILLDGPFAASVVSGVWDRWQQYASAIVSRLSQVNFHICTCVHISLYICIFVCTYMYV